LIFVFEVVKFSGNQPHALAALILNACIGRLSLIITTELSLHLTKCISALPSINLWL